MKESTSKKLVTSMCTARQEKQMKRAPERLSSDLLSLIISGQNISTPQYVIGAALVHLSCGRSANFWYPIFPRSLRDIIHLRIKCPEIAVAFTICMSFCLG